MRTDNTNTPGNSNIIVSFSFENHAVRGFEYRGEAHFIGNEVTDALGYTNASKALNDHCKALKKLNYNESLEMGLTEQGKNLRGISIIPERDVYRLVMRSNLPTAEAFEEKVVGEILPAIRKTGGYMLASPEETPEELALRAMSVLQATVERQKGQIADLSPKAVALQRIADAEGSLNLTEVAKALHVKRKDLIGWLGVHGWIYRRKGSGNWLGYASKEKAGYLTHKVNIERMPDGEDRVHEQVRITPMASRGLHRQFPELSWSRMRLCQLRQPLSLSPKRQRKQPDTGGPSLRGRQRWRENGPR